MFHFITPGGIAHVVQTWGYLGIFLCVFLGNVGLPVPEETVVLAAGFVAGRDLLSLQSVMLVAFVSAVLGDNFGYLLGRMRGRQIIQWLLGSSELAQQRFERFKLFFQAHGSKTVFFARFIAGLRFAAGPMAGAAGMPFARFVGWNVLGAFFWCISLSFLGYQLGDHWEQVAGVAQVAGQWFAIGTTAAALLLIYPLWLRRRLRGIRGV